MRRHVRAHNGRKGHIFRHIQYTGYIQYPPLSVQTMTMQSRQLCPQLLPTIFELEESRVSPSYCALHDKVGESVGRDQ
jgi:hypothetical protein